MAHANMLDKNKTVLVVIDFQEAFRRSIPDFEELAANISNAVRGFDTLGIPVIVTEQYPKGLGHTAGEILSVLPSEAEVIEKTAFSSCGALEFTEKLDELNAKQILICGLETHICVNQTAHDLLDAGFDVHILEDAVGSRNVENKQTGLKKMQAGGAVASCVEMALFELMGDSKDRNFKAIQQIIK
ncbi:MAG: hydrolase [Pyrinomonadaceae bacterium]